MLESLIFWLRKIEKNQNGEISHWQIKVVFQTFFDAINTMPDEELKNTIFPFFAPLLDANTHNHKALIARFMLTLILDHEERKKRKNKIDPDSF